MNKHEKDGLRKALDSWMILEPEWVRKELAERLADKERLESFDATWLIALNEILRRWTGPKHE